MIVFYFLFLIKAEQWHSKLNDEFELENQGKSKKQKKLNEKNGLTLY